MNLVRNFVRRGRPSSDGYIQSVDNTLGLAHLRKLFSEFRHPSPGATQEDQEAKLYNMLPLFCKVFDAAPSGDMTEKFGDVLQFCSHVSKLMVNEIRRRASNQSTDAASCAIVKFLEIDSTEESSNGWMLLSSLNLLSSGVPSLIDCMTAASLPSTLVKCLYLFFDLPDVQNADVLLPGSEFSPRERRVLLQKVFVQLLVRLCSHVSPAEELARKDDLTLLFSAITSWCPPHNVPWRKSAAEVLMTLSRHGLTPNVVQYIHNKGCVALCIDNMQRVQELSPIEIVEMFVTVFCFLKDSSEVSQILLDDFRSCQGYIFLADFLLRLEHITEEEAKQALRNLVLLVGSLTSCGFIELKPSNASTGNLFQMPGFQVPQPSNNGASVRNMQAFQVLQTVFLKSCTSHLCSVILDVISSIYHQDNANYFILEPQCTLSQFAEKIHLKPPDIQYKFFEILEFIVFHLNFVPCKELISISILIKTHNSVECSILCMKTLLKILRYHGVYKDVFREVGLLEVMVTCLHRYAALLKDPQNGNGGPEDMAKELERLLEKQRAASLLQEEGGQELIEKVSEPQQELGYIIMEALSLLLNGNSNNASVFRECGGARCAHNMVPYLECRHQALNIVQQLVLTNGGDDDMGTLLGLMHTAPATALELKTHVLKSLLSVLRESHRTRTVFRKVGGFVYVMSVLVSMEGCLADPPKTPWENVSRKEIVTLLKTVFSTLTVAMRYEPANARFFATEVRYASLTEAVRLLGCFSSETHIKSPSSQLTPSDQSIFDEYFCDMKDNGNNKGIPRTLLSACLMVRYLYDMALDAFDKPFTSPAGQPEQNSNAMKRMSSYMDTPTNSQQMSPSLLKRASTGSVILNLNLPQQEPLIVHAGAVTSILHLVPAVIASEKPQLELDLQWHMAGILKALMRLERNQQVMCEAGLPHELLTSCNLALYDESDPLHPPLQYVFERLSAQSLTPKDLRDFLRLGNPLCSLPAEPCPTCSLEDISGGAPLETNNGSAGHKKQIEIDKKLQSNGGAVPLTRVKCLVSMTTPRDVRLHGASITPAFVEFDMSAEGFGCLYLPSIAPQGPPTPSVVGVGMVGGSDSLVVGGIGTGERLFPPQSGLTFSTWICVDKFSCNMTDPHPVRLLTIVRNIQGRDENLICLSVSLAPRDRAMIVSTQETHMPTSVYGEDNLPVVGEDKAGNEFEHEPILNESTVRFWSPELTQEGQWHHIVLIFHRAGIMKNSSVSLFVDGDHISTQKLHYISPSLGGGGTASPAAVTSVFTYVGTPPPLRRQSRLTWRQGPAHLFEDIVSTSSVSTIYTLGPNYVGSFQSPILDNGEVSSPLISEDKLMFGVHAHAMSLMTIAKIRKVYNKTDSKSIAKQLAMSAHENATPIRILHNSAGHLSGPARSLGSILMGYLGVRTFCPKPVAKMLLNVGGMSAMLGLIAMATDVEGLYAAVKALVCVVRSNKGAMREMDRTKGYQTLAMLFKKKRHLLNSHILHLTFSLVGTVDSGRESSVIPNKTAFEDLLCDLEVWHEAPGDLQRSLYEHFFELLTESSDLKTNFKLMQGVGLVEKLLHILKDPSLSDSTVQTVACVLEVLLQGIPDHKALLRFGQFMVSTLPNFSVSEKNISLDSLDQAQRAATDEDHGDYSGLVSIHSIRLRNVGLDIIMKLMMASNGTQINQHVSDEIQRVLGFDWLLLFMQGHLHRTSVVSAMRILLIMLGHQGTMTKFREGNSVGGWLDDAEIVLENRTGVIAGFNVGTSNNRGEKREINKEICHLPGFTALQWLLPKQAHVAELYFLLMALLLGQPVRKLPEKLHFDLDSVWTFIFGVPASQPAAIKKRSSKAELCPEGALVILSMARNMLNQSWQSEDEGSWLREYPVTLMQFLLFLYHNQPDFVPLCMSGEFLAGLAATLFPYRVTSESNSEVSSPVEEFKPFPGGEAMVLVTKTEKLSSTLSNHPARKFVMDFLRMIIVDSLSLPLSSKSAPVIDLLLEASPEHATRTQQREFQTEILKSLMDHLLAADALLGEQAALPIATGGSYANMANNVFYFASRVVDKLWQGVYLRESKEVFDFISQLISQAKRRATGLSLDSIYRCLNRTILYQLSRPMFTVSEQMIVLDALHKLTSNRSLVFGPGNYDQEFIGCLCYCLLQLTEDPDNPTEPIGLRTTTWHVDPDEDSDEEMQRRAHLSSPENPEGLQLVANAAKRVWEELYVCKKPALEEMFKVNLNQNVGDPNASPRITTPDLMKVRTLIVEVATKTWVTFVENERKNSFKDLEKIQSQLQSKLQKVSSGVLRLARSKTKKEMPVRASPASVHDTNTWTFNHISIVKDLVELQYKQYLQAYQYMMRYLLEEWSSMEAELMRPRGLWGPPMGHELDKWQLDMTEAGPCRMRKKMMPNDMFYVHYPFRPDIDQKPAKYKVAVSRDSEKFYHVYRSHSLVGEENFPVKEMDEAELTAAENVTMENGEISVKNSSLLRRKKNKNQGSSAPAAEDEDEKEAEGGSEGTNHDAGGERAEENTENQTILRLLEEGEKISYMFRCVRIQGLDTMEGLLLFGKEHFYVVDGFTMLKTKEIADIDNLPVELHDPIIPKTSKNPTGTCKRQCGKYAYDVIREVHKRRYLLQPIALEVFSSDGRNILLAFPRKIKAKVYTRFLSVGSDITDNAQQSLSGQKQNAKVEPGTGLISGLLGEKSVTQRWERGEISNFQYLMNLNTLAGRSYNDLMQYPVFPWIVADYSSDELDLSNPATFRDLSKPMGAQTPDRLKQFRKRYTDWDDPQGETPPYHYGTHYSSAMIVASYLVRMEPFTQHFLRLQGGHFDLADRMFHSIKDSWMSASKHNMADVKELIPEFFYLPEFLNNSNNFDLGNKQSGLPLNDVVLPLWAKGNTQEFIRAHREALECDYVSAHLHEWIDLIFGYKQQGPAAVDTTNVFHHLFYEGNVDIYSIDDPLKKNATIGFINNFGQIPKQLFKKPHPQKKLSLRNLEPIPMGSLINTMADRLFFHNLDNLKPTMQPIKELKGAVGQIIHNDKTALAVEQNKVLIPPLYNKYLAWGFADMSIRIGSYDSDKASAVFETVDNGDILCASCPDAKLVITAGTSTVVNVWQFGKGKEKKQLVLKQPLYGHTEPVTCLASSSSYNMIVSGSRDRTCIIWDMSRLLFVRQLLGHAAPVAAVCVNELTGEIASCAGTYLHVWTINGDEIASVNTATARNQQILCVTMSQMMEWDQRNCILTGSSDGVVRMWSIEFVEVPDESKVKVKELKDGATSGGGRKSSEPLAVPAPGAKVTEHRLSDDFKDHEYLSVKETELGSSADSEGNILDTMTERLKRGKEHTEPDRPLFLTVDRSMSNMSTISTLTPNSVASDREKDFEEGSTTPTGEQDPCLSNQDDRSSDRSVDVSVGLDALDLDDNSSINKSTPSLISLTDDVQFSQSETSSISSAGQPPGTNQMSAKPSGDGKPANGAALSPTTAEFHIVTDNEVQEAVKTAEDVIQKYKPVKRMRILRDGFKWQCQLVFRSKLTMHTAFERRDNKDPAAVTSVAISRDHKTVYVGDAKGRVYSWSVTDQPGRVVADHWVKDEGGDGCVACGVKFSFSERRHHCRNCGQLFCSKCSRFETEIRRLRIVKPVRVCQACYNILRAQQSQEAMGASKAEKC